MLFLTHIKPSCFASLWLVKKKGSNTRGSKLERQLHIHKTQESQNTLKLTHTTMECTWPESIPSNKKKAIEELVQGRDIANKLRSLLNKSAGDNNNNNNNSKAAPAEDLVVKILNSFTNSLYILNSAESDEVSQIQANTHVTNWNGGPKSSESSEETSRNTTHKDRRGCYKRR